jgi:O-antigen/teichoic acid export membrane protein
VSSVKPLLSKDENLSRWTSLRGYSGFLARDGVRGLYGAVNHVTAPLLWLIATPLLVASLGVEQYGIYSLAIALIGSLGIVHVGFGDAVTKYVSEFRGNDDLERIERLLRTAIALFSLLGAVVLGVVWLTSPLVVRALPALGSAETVTAVRLLWLVAIAVFLRLLEVVYSSALRGYERYDLLAKIGVGINVTTVAAAVIIAMLTKSVPLIVASAVLLIGVSALVHYWTFRSVTGFRTLMPAIDGCSARQLMAFSKYSWLQGAGGTMFNYFDRVLIGATLGAVPLGYYAICMQLAQQVQGLTAAGLNFLFPAMSSAFARNDRYRARFIYRFGLATNAAVAVALAFPLIFFSSFILTVWVGASIAAEVGVVLAILALAHLILAMNVTAHYTLIAAGRIRLVALTNLAAGIIMLMALPALLSIMGLLGAGVARLLYGPIIATLNFPAARVAKNVG